MVIENVYKTRGMIYVVMGDYRRYLGPVDLLFFCYSFITPEKPVFVPVPCK